MSNHGKTQTTIIRNGLMLTVLAALIAAPAAMGAEIQDGEADSPLVHTATIPLKDGKVPAGEMLGAVADALGLDGEAMVEALPLEIPVASGMGKVILDQLQKVTARIMRFDVSDDQLVITFDRVRLRRQEKELRRRFRAMVEQWFPDQTSAASEQFGLYVWSKAESRLLKIDSFVPDDRVVVLVHGIDEPRRIWDSLRPMLLEAGHTVVQLEYPNDQPIADSAEFFAQEMKRLRSIGVRQVSIVAHSMGGLVTRQMLTHEDLYGGRGSGHAQYPDINRLIMIGTPNHGSELARLQVVTEVRDQVARMFSGDGYLFGAIVDGAGEAKIDLLPGSDFLSALNARPLPSDVRFTIIAGRASPITDDDIERLRRKVRESFGNQYDKSMDEIASTADALIAGVGDGCVSLASTRLEGVDDYVIVDGNHLTIIRSVPLTSKRVPPAATIVMDRLSTSRF